jgi:hypothetical protein
MSMQVRGKESTAEAKWQAARGLPTHSTAQHSSPSPIAPPNTNTPPKKLQVLSHYLTTSAVQQRLNAT